MARYYQRPQNDIVDLTPRIPLEFYSNMINQAQQNLNQATASGAAFMTDIYGQEVIDQAARDKAMELGKAPIEQALDREFVTPAAMAKAVTQASAAIAPWKNLNKKQLELIKQADMYKLQNPDALVTDPRSLNLLDEKGNWVSPETLNLKTLDPTKTIDRVFDESERGVLESISEGRVNSDIPYYYKLLKKTGLSEAEKADRYGRNTDITNNLLERQLSIHPEVVEFFNGDVDKAKDYIYQRNLAKAGQYKYGEDSQYIQDDWSLYMAKKRAENPPPTQERLFFPKEGGIVENPIVSQGMGQIMANLTGGTTAVNWDHIEANLLNADGNMMASGKVKVPETNLRAFQRNPYTGSVGTSPGNNIIPNTQYREARTQLNRYKELTGNKNMSDREALGMMKSAAANSAQFYGLTDDALSDLYTGNNLNPFEDVNKGIKDFKTFSPELFNASTGKWEAVSYDQLAEKVGFEGDDKKALSDQLRDGSTKTFNYSSGEPKLVSNIVGGDGSDYTLRYNPSNTEVTRISRPYAKVQQSLITPGEHVVSFNNLIVKYKTVPTQVTDEYGQPKVVNKIVGLRVTHGPDGDYDKKQANDQIIQVLEQTQTPEDYLMYYTRLYRDEQLFNRQHVYKSTKPKE